LMVVASQAIDVSTIHCSSLALLPLALTH
jgi:hypothetical protein